MEKFGLNGGIESCFAALAFIGSVIPKGTILNQKQLLGVARWFHKNSEGILTFAQSLRVITDVYSVDSSTTLN